MEKADNGSRNSEVLCRVCGDKASGKHYGVASCDGCRGFFKRSIRRNLDYVCKENNACIVDVTRRNQCQACRFRKCLQVNMKRDAVQHERAPRTASQSGKSKYVPCYPYYFPFKPTIYNSPFLGSSNNLMSAAAAAAAASNLPFELPSVSGKFDLLSGTPPGGMPPSLGGGQLLPGILPLEAHRRILQSSAHLGGHHPLGGHIEDGVLPPSFQMLTRSGGMSTPGLMDSLNAKRDPVMRCGSGGGGTNGGGGKAVKLESGLRSSPSSDSSAGVKEDEVSSSGTDMQNGSVFKLDLNLLSVSNDNVYESAAKLLFLSVKWARSVPSFLHLPFGDQSMLLEEAWPELFILSAAQWSLPIDEGLLLTGSLVPRNQQEALITELRFLKEALIQISSIRPDHTELACLKALVLFKPEVVSLRERLQVEILQDQTHLMLQEYCLTKQPPNKIRFGKLLLVLPHIRRISGKTLEELFFKQTVGDVPIQRLLCDMFKAP